LPQIGHGALLDIAPLTIALPRQHCGGGLAIRPTTSMNMAESNHAEPRRCKPCVWTHPADLQDQKAGQTVGSRIKPDENFGLNYERGQRLIAERKLARGLGEVQGAIVVLGVLDPRTAGHILDDIIAIAARLP
jgi:hypothetical protein